MAPSRVAKSLSLLAQLEGYHRPHCMKQLYNGILAHPNEPCSCGLDTILDLLKRADIAVEDSRPFQPADN